MEGFHPENITHGELADMVQMGSLDRETVLANPEDGYAAARLAYKMAQDRGDARAIEDAEQRLTSILDAHPHLLDN